MSSMRTFTFMFQSLIGNLQTKNFPNSLGVRNKLFQSLIGNLQTSLSFCLCACLLMFQSLIGNLQTLYAHVIEKYEAKFQSLIGNLQTPTPFATPFVTSWLRFNPS